MAEEHVTGFERDLAILLDVEPSPEFRPRVRARIEADRRAPRTGWRWALAACAAIALLATAGTWLREPVILAPAPKLVSSGRGTDVRLAIASPPPSAATAPGRRRVHHLQDPVPLVIVDRAQADAVRRLIDVAARAPLAAAVVPPVDVSTPAVTVIPVDPVRVEPLPVAELNLDNKGVHQ